MASDRLFLTATPNGSIGFRIVYDTISVDDLPSGATGIAVTGEAFTGDGSAVNFVLAHTPLSGSVAVYVNGIRVQSYTVSGSTVTFAVAPALDDEILVDYRY